MTAYLKENLLFADFTDEELKAIRSISRKSKFQGGEYAFREEEPGDSLIILDLGTLRLTKKTRSGEETELVQLGSGA